MNHPADAPQTPDGTDTSDPAASPTRRRAMIAGGAALVVGGVALAVWAVTAAGPATPEAQPVPTGLASAPATPTAAPSDSASGPAPVASGLPPTSVDAPVISAFTVTPTIAVCADDRDSTVPLTFSWSSEGADRAWIGIGTSDASAQPAAEVDPDDDSFTGVLYACSDADQVFTLTVQGAGGTLSSTIAISRDLG